MQQYVSIDRRFVEFLYTALHARGANTCMLSNQNSKFNIGSRYKRTHLLDLLDQAVGLLFAVYNLLSQISQSNCMLTNRS